MRSSLHILPLSAAAMILIAACSGTPDGVLDKEQMASLMADIHKGEAAIDINQSEYGSDSMRHVVRKSIYDAHGVTEAEVDSSFRYYGHHIEEYLEVYDMAIDRLKTQLENADAVTVMNTNMSVSGDSVEVWPYARNIVLGPSSPSDFVKWQIERDDTWKPGDTYVWAFKVLNTTKPFKARVMVDYADGTIEWIDAQLAEDGKWMNVSFTLDTLSAPLRIYGMAQSVGQHNEYIYLDSISLHRMHAIEGGPQVVRYRYRTFRP